MTFVTVGHLCKGVGLLSADAKRSYMQPLPVSNHLFGRHRALEGLRMANINSISDGTLHNLDSYPHASGDATARAGQAKLVKGELFKDTDDRQGYNPITASTITRTGSLTRWNPRAGISIH